MKQISTTALSNILEIPTKELFLKLRELKLIIKKDNSWALTDEGQSKGGEYKESSKYGKYIVWPETFTFDDLETSNTEEDDSKFVNSTIIGKHFELTANKVNYILSELGWVKKGFKGWLLTEQGQKQQNGVQRKNYQSGVPFAKWPQAILESKVLIETISHIKGVEPDKKLKPETPKEQVGFREKFEAKHRATDGHFVRSKAEMLIDNWLYMVEIVHAYERKLPIEEDVYSDFYIPTGKVYIEYWGYENEPKYLARKKVKQELYKKYGFNLIELEDKEVQNIDDILPKLLLKYGIQSY
ncbi:MAG: hypothetical protein KAH84_03185 [Thiomargarita sp.]|nr:hypothetical protein [Thiomargarita sp.]